jgi:polyphosphate kinase
MVRNLDRRVEVAAPIYCDELKQELKDYFNLQFSDNQKSRYVNHEIENKYVENQAAEKIRFQNDFYYYLKKKEE